MMNAQDKKISQLYKETYMSTKASDDFKRKVRNMTEQKNTRKVSMKKIIAVAAAAVIAVTGGVIATSASHKTYIGQYTTAYFNGEEVQARYGVWDNINTYIVEFEGNGKTYTAYIQGDFDKDTMPLYFRDEGKYAVASTDPNQQLNLYDDIDKAPHAWIEDDMLVIDNSYLYEDETPDYPEGVTDIPRRHTNQVSLSYDMNDGKKDGVLKYSTFEYDAYIISPEGLIIDTFKSRKSMMDESYYVTEWGLIWGEESEESYEEYMDAYRDSDGNIVIE